MTRWIDELETPTEAFFHAFAEALESRSEHELVREAVLHLAPRLDWAGYLPQMPHGLLGLLAALELQPLLAPPRFRRLLATQLHVFALEGRTQGPSQLPPLGPPEAGIFRDLLRHVAPDMANIGHKAAAVEAARRAWASDPELGAQLQSWARWVAAAPPEDRFWHARMARRSVGEPLPLAAGPPRHDAAWHLAFAREIGDLGLAALLDALVARMRQGASTGDLLAGLTLAAAEKQLAARRDMEGKTSWNFVYLASLEALESPEAWGQAAALVNFFPGEDEAPAWSAAPEATPEALLEAVLDGEAERALCLALGLPSANVLRVVAEAVCLNDPGLHHSHPTLAVAAAARLLPALPEWIAARMLAALAKSLANSQGGDELGRKAELVLTTVRETRA